MNLTYTKENATMLQLRLKNLSDRVRLLFFWANVFNLF